MPFEAGASIGTTGIYYTECLRRTAGAHVFGMYACIGYAGTGPRCSVEIDVLAGSGEVLICDTPERQCLIGEEPFPQPDPQLIARAPLGRYQAAA